MISSIFNQIMIKNTLTKLLSEFPDKEWYWYLLSENPNITWDIINDNPDKLWNRWGISRNPNITFSIIQSNPDKPWDWYNLSLNKFENDPYFTSVHYFTSNSYKKKITNVFHNTIHEELISKACHPIRVLNWMDEVNEPDCIYYGMTQADINKLFKNEI